MGNDRSDAPDDRELVRRFLHLRDERAFRALWQRHAPRMHGVLLRLLRGDARAAEDALQDAWIRAAERLGGFRWESALSTWLTGIAVHRALELGRAEGRRRRREEQVAGEQQVGGEQQVAGEEQAVGAAPRAQSATNLDLERALARLPDEGRDVLLLHDVEGYTHGEIARMLGIEEGTSKSRLSRARGAMRAMLRAPAATGQ